MWTGLPKIAHNYLMVFARKKRKKDSHSTVFGNFCTPGIAHQHLRDWDCLNIPDVDVLILSCIKRVAGMFLY